MKVCMIAHSLYSRDARIQRYANALASTGHQVDVLCLRGSEAPTQLGIRVFTIPIRHTASRRWRYLLEYTLSCICFTLQLLVLYARNRYQIIHVHNMPDILAITAILPRLVGAKLILDIHDPMPEFYMSKFAKRQANSLLPKVIRLQERLAISVVHAVITANANFKANLIKRGIPASKITVVNNLPDPHVFNRQLYHISPGDKAAHFTLIYLGTMAPRYGLHVPIRALPLLIQGIPNIKLVLMGAANAYTEELVTLAAQLGVAAYVDVKPPVPLGEVAQHLAQADVGIYSALPDPHMNIATPTKVLEYAMMGVPVIASRVQVLEQLFPKDAIMFFEPGNVEQFAQCVVALFESHARRKELVNNADRAFVHTHSWSQERMTYFALLKRLLDPVEEVDFGGDEVRTSVSDGIQRP